MIAARSRSNWEIWGNLSATLEQHICITAGQFIAQTSCADNSVQMFLFIVVCLEFLKSAFNFLHLKTENCNEIHVVNLAVLAFLRGERTFFSVCASALSISLQQLQLRSGGHSSFWSPLLLNSLLKSKLILWTAPLQKSDCCSLTFSFLTPGSISSCDAFLNVFQSKGLRQEVICPCASSPEALTVAIRRYGVSSGALSCVCCSRQQGKIGSFWVYTLQSYVVGFIFCVSRHDRQK